MRFTVSAASSDAFRIESFVEFDVGFRVWATAPATCPQAIQRQAVVSKPTKPNLQDTSKPLRSMMFDVLIMQLLCDMLGPVIQDIRFTNYPA